MTQAYLVNPHDGHQLEAAILAALNAPMHEQQRRMRYLQRSVSAWTNEDWVGSFLQALNR
jgi:trehalose-6-phosphate synthase